METVAPSDFMMEMVSRSVPGGGRQLEFSNVLHDLASDSLANSLELDKRHGLIWRLEKCLKNAQADEQWNLPHLSMVEDLSLNMFGSSVMGTCAPAGDLDISLEGWVNDSGNRVCLSDRSEKMMKFKKGLLKEVQHVFENPKSVVEMEGQELLSDAKVPVFQFLDRKTSVRCDISVGNNAGVFKSHVMSLVLELDDRVRDLVVLVKKSLKANGWNDPKRGSFNSYCLTLLVAVFAQSRLPPLLPAFRDLFPASRSDVAESSPLSFVHTYREATSDWAQHISQNEEENEETLAQLLLGFFGWLSVFANHSQLTRSIAETAVRPTAGVWDGGVVCTSWPPKCLQDHHLFVEDPFEEGENCARTVKPDNWGAICDFLRNMGEAIDTLVCSSSSESLHNVCGLLFGEQAPNIGVVPPQNGIPLCKDMAVVSTVTSLHAGLLVRHLQKFSESGKDVIVIIGGWWGWEIVPFCAKVERLRTLRSDRLQNKYLIGNDEDVRAALLRQTVASVFNSTTTVNPEVCVFRQKLREFSEKCTPRNRLHLQASAFEKGMLQWVVDCVEAEGLNREVLPNGDVIVSKPPGENCESEPLESSSADRNEQVIQHVFLLLYDQLAALNTSENPDEVAEIDPAEHIAPTGWVRHQVREIAHHLFLHVLPPNGNARSARTVRVAKEPPSDSFHSEMEVVTDLPSNCEEAYTEAPVGAVSSFSPTFPGPLQGEVHEECPEDYVGNWLWGIQQEGHGGAIRREFYPPEVEQAIEDQAKVMGLWVKSKAGKMCVQPHPQWRVPSNGLTVHSRQPEELDKAILSAHHVHMNAVMDSMQANGLAKVSIALDGFIMEAEWIARQLEWRAKVYGFQVLPQDTYIDVVDVRLMPNQQLISDDDCMSFTMEFEQVWEGEV